jgi:predicted flavoprotein YhiN
MESKLNKGMYFIGETLNVHGPIGGFNITIALSTGYSAASNIGRN